MGQTKTKSQLQPETVFDLTRETGLASDEILKAYHAFIKDYPNGKMTKDQLKNVYIELLPEGDPSDFVDYVFRTFDANGDGHIDFKEFVIALSATSRDRRLDKKAEWIFSVYDLDSNGYITKSEMTEVMASVCKMTKIPTDPSSRYELTPEQRVEKIYELMDKNHDENLSLEEFVEGVRENPDVEDLVSFSLEDSHAYLKEV